MPISYLLTGFNDYVIIDKVLYRKPYTAKSKSCEWQYRKMRKIKRVVKDGTEGYFLVKNKKRKFYSLASLRHRLKKII